VSLHPPESLHAPGRWGVKVAYAAAFAILGAVAIVCVIKQSRETAVTNQKLTTALDGLNGSTKEIARVTALNTSLQQQLLGESSRIAKLAQESFRTITGANSFPYLAPQPSAYPSPIPLFVWDYGKYMLTGVTISIRDWKDFSYYQTPVDVGVLHPGWGKPLPLMLQPKLDDKTGEAIYLVDFYTQSEFFTQILHVRKSHDGKWWAFKFWVQVHKFAARKEKLPPVPKLARLPPGGSNTYTVYDRSQWSDEMTDSRR
jgi:hypothetical protein